MKFPDNSIRLEKIEDLFQPNEDTKNQSPRTILVVGRPGIGKTVLTKKVMYDWAKGDVDFYHGKIVFLFKFRYFSFDPCQKLTLKEFFRLGTNLSDKKFEEIFSMVTHSPQNVILIFDGLDEFCSNYEKFEANVQQSQAYDNDPSVSMTAMLLSVKIIYGFLLKGAKVLVTSRPTASDAYSKIEFDREVEIIGFTSDKIKEYVEQFCAQNNHKPNPMEEIWNHIKSSPELKNLCYIPVNCFIICSTLSYIFSNRTGHYPLPTTITELYDIATVYFCQNLRPKGNKECIMQLQKLAFGEMNKNNLVFNAELVDNQMKESGLLHCLPVPFPHILNQFCFIHLTIQEFLAAKHIVEMNEIKEIEEFISSHFEQSRWHLVLQFLAGLLGKKMKDYADRRSELRRCVLHFGEYLSVYSEELYLGPSELLVMKCFRETLDESLGREVATSSRLRDVKKISNLGVSPSVLSPSDGAAIAFVCKHLNRLTDLRLSGINNLDCLRDVTKILQEKCISKLYFGASNFGNSGLKHLFDVLTNSECHMAHEHSKLTKLALPHNKITDTGVSHLTDFLEKGCNVTQCEIPQPCKVLDRGVCGQLRVLNIDDNNLSCDSVENLCEMLIKVQSKLTTLSLRNCSLTCKCVFWLAQILSDENCELTDLILEGNDIRDEGVRVLCDALLTENRELNLLDLSKCSLTDECTTALFEVLASGFCELKILRLGNNDIRDEGLAMLCCALRKKECTLTALTVSHCLLTDECMPSLSRALKDKVCRLTQLSVSNNAFTNKHLPLLSHAVNNEHCRLKNLKISWNNFGKQKQARLSDIKKYSEV